MERLVWAGLNALSFAVLLLMAFVVESSIGAKVSMMAGLATAVAALLAGLREKPKGVSGNGYLVSAAVSTVGFGSWFSFEPTAINIFGVLAMPIGVVGLLVFGLVWVKGSANGEATD